MSYDRDCPDCDQTVTAAASYCPFCGHELATDDEPDGAGTPHTYDPDTLLEKFDSSEWRITNRLIDVDTDEVLYRVCETDSNRNVAESEIVTEALIDRSFELVDEPEIRTDGGTESGNTRRSDLRMVDLFCGCGGATCGAWQAGATPVAGVDHNPDALETHAANLPGEHIEHDLRNVQPSILPPLRIDWVHGSPPCQGFSQAKGNRDPDDHRNQLVFRFVDWVEAISPKVVTMENVSGMQTISNHFLDHVQGAFREAGYDARWRCLNAADYGVPQTRKRIFFVGVREDLPTPSRWFPRPTHAETPTTTLDGRRLEEWRSVREAIGDLADDIPAGAELTSQQNEAHQKAGRRPFHTVEHPARTIRCGTPPEVETDGGASIAAKQPPNHVAQDHEKSTRERFAEIPLGNSRGGISNRRLHPDRPSFTICAAEGAGVPPIHYQGRAPNHVPTDHAAETRRHMARLEYGESENSTTERRLHPEQPSPTITASERSPPIHYQGPVIPKRVADEPSCTVLSERPYLSERGHADHIQERDVRRLTVREAARLQSFDDWFVFQGTKTEQLRQVGNAVPPRLQQFITEHVRQIIDSMGSDHTGGGGQ